MMGLASTTCDRRQRAEPASMARSHPAASICAAVCCAACDALTGVTCISTAALQASLHSDTLGQLTKVLDARHTLQQISCESRAHVNLECTSVCACHRGHCCCCCCCLTTASQVVCAKGSCTMLVRYGMRQQSCARLGLGSAHEPHAHLPAKV